jgi:hypothetical protein
MPLHSEGHKSKGSKKEKAAKSRGQKTRQGRKGRATRSSRAVITEYASKIKNGKNTGSMFLAKVVTAPGGGHFSVEDMSSKEKVMAHVTPALSMRSAKHANSTDEFAVRVGSHVLVDGNIIRAVVPDGRLSAVREENESSGSKNSVFSRGGSTRKNRH